MKIFYIILSYIISYGVIALSGYVQMLVIARSQMFNTSTNHTDTEMGWSFWLTVTVLVAWIMFSLWKKNYFVQHLWVLVLSGVGLAIVLGIVANAVNLK